MSGQEKLVERLKSIDPDYGSQAHQRAFVERMEEAQRIAPCAKDHEHATSCYPEVVMVQIGNRQRKERS